MLEFLKPKNVITEEDVKELLLYALGQSALPTIQSLVDEIRELKDGTSESAELQDEIDILKIELSDLKITKRESEAKIELDHEISERDLKHLVKIKESKLELESKTKELTIKSEHKDKELAMQKEYFEKSMTQVNESRKEIRGFFDEVMKRLPNVNMDIQKDIVK